MPDIRNFFGGKGATQSTTASQEPKPVKTQKSNAKPKGRGKRKVVSDSEEDETPPPKKSTPKKAAPKKPLTQEPVGEATTTADYFASSGKSKPKRSTPVKPKAAPNGTKTPATPQNKHVPLTPTRLSSRPKGKPSYTEVKDDDEASGDDVFGDDFKRTGRTKGDDYASDDDEEDEGIKTVRTSRKKEAKEQNGSFDGTGDLQMEDEDNEDDFAAPTKKRGRPSKIEKPAPVSRGRKRKSADFEEDEDEDDDEGEEDGVKPARSKPSKNVPKATPKATLKATPKVTPAKSATQSPAAKKVKTTKEPEAESKAMQDIFDSIPLIRPPMPPARDPEKKFDFRANAQRSQPVASSGTKELPVGNPNCLAGLSFVFTGILDTLDRDTGVELVKRYGGKVVGAPSSRTSYVVLGNDAGPKKLETIQKFGLKVVNENGLFALIRVLPPNGGDSKAAEKYEERQKAEAKKVEKMAEEMEKEEKKLASLANQSNGIATKPTTATTSGQGSQSVEDRLWTVKYAPTSLSQICGNTIQVQKLQAWLRAFPDREKKDFRMAGPDGTGTFRAVMISGPPGIGKTTAAHLAAKLEGYDIVESNASDTRSKKLVDTGVKGILDTTSLLGYFAGDGKKVDQQKRKLVLIMDEVDGMSAGDRGGVGALAALCKKTRIPIILICNERTLPKMRPFDGVTYGLPFRKPTTDQVRARIMTILFREGMKELIPKPVVDALIEGSRADIRQIINMISQAKLDQQAMDFDSGKKMSNAWEKHVILKPWDIVGKILGGGMFAPASTSTLNDKIELYFNDHDISPLMLQENYLKTNPMLSNNYNGREKNFKWLELADKAAESISDGDLVDRMIHGSQQQWSLMPTHAVFSFVRPASFISGSLAGHGQVVFPGWLGQNSKATKLARFSKEIQGHMRLRTSGDRHEVRQQYLPLLWQRLVRDLQDHGKDHISAIIKLMDYYYLTKDDWDAIVELGVGPMDEKNVKLDAPTKSAFTRTYNQKSHPMPFMKASNVLAPKKGAGGVGKEKPDLEEALDESDEGDLVDDAVGAAEDESGEELDLKKDKYVSAPKRQPASKKKAASKTKTAKDEDDGLDESEEDVKPAKGKAKSKGRASTGGTAKKGKK